MTPTKTVAIIGGGISGICCAHACVEHGLSVTLFDRRPSATGIWSAATATPVFDNLTTNTICFENALSDVPPLRVGPSSTLSDHDNLCITREEFETYLLHVTHQTPGFDRLARFEVSVDRVERVADRGYYVHSKQVSSGNAAGDQGAKCEFFDYVVVASGSQHTPHMPTDAIPGLGDFPGEVYHVSDYKSPRQVTGKRVLVVGGSMSGCEAAGDMASAAVGEAAQSVTLSARHMRHLICKQKDRHAFFSEVSTRFSRIRQLAGRLYENDGVDMLALANRFYSNDDFGAPPAEAPIFAPGAPNWCPVNYKVAQAGRSGKLKWNIGGITKVRADGVVEFCDGEPMPYDVIVLATGYKLSFPFLDAATNAMIRWEKLPSHLLDLHNHTFHPGLPGMAFAGILIAGNACTPMYDAQARWIARAFAHEEHMPNKAEMEGGVKAARALRDSPEWHVVTMGFEVLDVFAKLGGFEVDLSAFPEWTKALLLGPIVPAQFRLCGVGRREDAMGEFERQMTAAGFKRGDNAVDCDTLGRLKDLVDEQPSGSEHMGLREAVDYLAKVNLAAT